MTIFLGAMALLFALWVVYYEARRMLYPPQPEVVDLCDPADKTLSEQAAKQCRWVIPAKYVSVRLEQSKGRYFEARVPWIDIDPDYAFDPKNTVTFQFWPGYTRYANGIKQKDLNAGNFKPDKHGLLWAQSRRQFYFEAFDGIQVEVFSPPGFSQINPVASIYRPLSEIGSLHWIVNFPPNLASQADMDSYVQQNIREIDRKLIQFIDKWH